MGYIVLCIYFVNSTPGIVTRLVSGDRTSPLVSRFMSQPLYLYTHHFTMPSCAAIGGSLETPPFATRLVRSPIPKPTRTSTPHLLNSPPSLVRGGDVEVAAWQASIRNGPRSVRKDRDLSCRPSMRPSNSSGTLTRPMSSNR